ncbi:hypothetical protein ACVNPZ_02635 [Staphylococcus aureus]
MTIKEFILLNVSIYISKKTHFHLRRLFQIYVIKYWYLVQTYKKVLVKHSYISKVRSKIDSSEYLHFNI